MDILRIFAAEITIGHWSFSFADVSPSGTAQGSSLFYMGNMLPNSSPHLQRRQLDGGTSLIYPLRIIQRDIGCEEFLPIVGFAKKPVIDIVIQFGIIEKVVVAHVDLFKQPFKKGLVSRLRQGCSLLCDKLLDVSVPCIVGIAGIKPLFNTF